MLLLNDNMYQFNFSITRRCMLPFCLVGERLIVSSRCCNPINTLSSTNCEPKMLHAIPFKAAFISK